MTALPRPLVAWTLTTGETGMRTQARGLAQALAEVVVEKTAPRRPPGTGLAALVAWRWLAAPFGPPWPDLVVSCGRRSVPFAVAIRRAAAGRTLAVHIQDPRAFHAAFDLIVAMGHDRLAESERVMKVFTALHDVTPQALAAAAEAWRGRFAPLGRPLVGVAIGGDLRGRPFTLDDGRRLLAGLQRLRREGDAGLAVTPSRRTPAPVRALLREAFAGDPRTFLWELEGENPYLGILALSDRLVVTTDSVSMVSEAIATGRPVELFDLGFRRHVGFVGALVAQGLARRFDGDPAPPPAPAARLADPVQLAAGAVRRLLQERTGVVG